MKEENIKEMFVEMCKHIRITGNGLVYPYDTVTFEQDLNHIVNNDSYELLKEKMKNLLILINNDLELLNKDIESELWDLI